MVPTVAPEPGEMAFGHYAAKVYALGYQICPKWLLVLKCVLILTAFHMFTRVLLFIILAHFFFVELFNLYCLIFGYKSVKHIN